MKVYIAAPFSMRPIADAVMGQLVAAGLPVTSRWIREESVLCHEWAAIDLSDVADADALLALNPPEWREKGSGGRHVELGYAMAFQKHIVLVGVRSSIFHYHNRIHVVSTVEEAIEWLKTRP